MEAYLSPLSGRRMDEETKIFTICPVCGEDAVISDLCTECGCIVIEATNIYSDDCSQCSYKDLGC